MSCFFSSSRARTTAEGYASLAFASTATLISLYETRVISHIFKHNYSSDLSLSIFYNSGGGQMERSARLQAQVVIFVICESRPDNT